MLMRTSWVVGLVSSACLLACGGSGGGSAEDDGTDTDAETDGTETNAEDEDEDEDGTDTDDAETDGTETNDEDEDEDEDPAPADGPTEPGVRPSHTEGKQGIFATVNGEPLEATRAGNSNGYVNDSSFEDAYSHVILEATEIVGDREVDWSLWLPKMPGTYTCGTHTAGADIAHIAIDTASGNPMRSGVNSGISSDGCVVTVLSIDRDGIIEGSFSGAFGGFLGSSQVVTAGWFYVDNRRGGGDCSEAADPGVSAGEYGATASITRLEVEGQSAPKHLRCGQNVFMSPQQAGLRSSAPGVFFMEPDVYFGSVMASLQIDGLDRSAGNNVNCSNLRFGDFSVSGESDRCVVTLQQFDEELWAGTYEATLSATRNDETSSLDLVGSFRIPPAFTP